MCHIFFGAWLEQRLDLTLETKRALAHLVATQVYLDELARRLARARAGAQPETVAQAAQDFGERFVDLWVPLPGAPLLPWRDRNRAIREHIARIARGVAGEIVEG